MTRRLLWAAPLLLGGLFLGLYVHQVLLVPRPPLSADEAGHALPAARMAFALRDGSLRGFLDATHREVVWPFFHPWVITPFFLVFGVSAHVARLVSLVTFGAVLGLIPLFAHELARDAEPGAHRESSALPALGWLSIAVLITATPWPLVAMVMSESLGMLLTLAVLLAEARAARRQSVAGYVLAGLLAAATFFTKYSYGLPLMAAILLGLVGRRRQGGFAPLAPALAGMGLPIAAWLAWMLLPNPFRAPALLGAFVNRDEGLRGLAGLAFYPRVVVSAIGMSVAVVSALLLLASVARGRLGRRRPAVLFVGVALLMLMVHPNKQARYLLPILPVLFVLAETELSDWLRRLRGREILWPALAVMVLVARDPLNEIRWGSVGKARLEDARPIVAYVESIVGDRQPVLFLGTTGMLPHLALTWEILEHRKREPAVDLLPFPAAGPAGPRYRAGYPPGDGPEYDVALREALASGRFRSVVTLELGPASPFLPQWLAKWDAFGQNYVRAMARPEAQVDYALASERAFPESDATVRIFVRRDAGARGTDLARSADPSD